MRPSQRALLAVIVAGAPFLAAASASAQSTEVLSNTWRQENRSDAIAAGEGSSQLFAFELRFGPYYPKVDSEFNGKKTPFTDTFFPKTRAGTLFYFGLEGDFLPLRIPYVGLFGGGLGWGYTSVSAKTRLVSDPTQKSDEDTSLSIMPMYVVAVLRADELMRRTGIPLVPYGKFGLGFALWKASDGSGKSTYKDIKANKSYTGGGNSGGLQFALGAALSLNFIDSRSAARLDESTGVNHIYLFGEWMNSNLDNFGSSPAMRVGSSNFVGGIAFDM
jgi:hypothetical protein